MSNAVKKKIYSVIVIIICAVLLYFAMLSGDTTMIWGALALMLAGSGFLFANC